MFSCQKKVVCIETNEIFDSMVEAARKYGGNSSNQVYKCCKDSTKTFAGYHWKYKNVEK